MQVAVLPAPSYNGRMPKTRTKTVSKTFRLTESVATLLEACAAARGISMVSVLEIALRDFARTYGVNPNGTPSPPPTAQESREGGGQDGQGVGGAERGE